MDEFNIIDDYFRPLSTSSKESQNLTDDVALINNQKLVVSKDLMVEDIHFYKNDTPADIANRLLRSNLSDIAASGSKPLYYMLGFAKHSSVDKSFLSGFCNALKEINEEFNISLIGGDTVRANNDLFFSITIFGQHQGNILSRSNAKEEDLIYVSGSIGDAYLATMIKSGKLNTSQENVKFFNSRFYRPQPRIDLGQELTSQNLSKCAIDISDGLLADLNHICKTSKLNAIIQQENIPLSSEAKEVLQNNNDISIQDLISGGDDYELLFTVNKSDQEKINILSEKLGIPLTNIGYLTKTSSNKKSVKLFDKENEITIKKLGYEH